MWYASSASIQRKSALLKSTQQQQQKLRISQLEALKQPNAKIIQTMNSVANILQHRALMEQLGPAVISSSSTSTVEQRRQVEEENQFTQSLMMRSEDEGDDRKRNSCVML